MSAARGPSGSRHPQPTPQIGASTWLALGLLAVLGVFLALPGTPTSVRIGSLVAAALLARRVSIDIREVREDRAAQERPVPRGRRTGGASSPSARNDKAGKPQGPKGRRP